FEAGDISVTPVGSGTLSGFTDAGGGNYTATLSTPPGATSAAATIVVAADAVTDGAGNGNARTTANVFLIPVTPIITTPAENDYVTALNQAAFTVAGRARPNVDISVGVKTTTVSVTTGTDRLGAWSVSLDLSDPLIIGGAYVIGVRASEAGEGLSEETTVTVIKDTDVPTIRYSGVLPVTMVEGNTVTINLVASEATSDLTIEDITLTGSASVENFTSLSTSFYTVDLVAGIFTHPGTVTFAVGATTFTDVASQDNPTGTPIHSIQVTEIPPTYTVTGVPNADAGLPDGSTEAGAIEGDDLVFVVTRSKPTTVPAGEAVGYDLTYMAPSNPAAAEDFNSADIAGDGIIAMGQATVTLTVRTADDDSFEQTEQVDFVARVARVEVARGSGVIINNDAPPPPVIIGPADGGFANAATLAIRVFGTSAARGGGVKVTADGVARQGGAMQIVANGSVVNGVWTADLDLSMLPDGMATIMAQVRDVNGDFSTAASARVTKDTVIPSIGIEPVHTILSPGQSTNVTFHLDDGTARSFTGFDLSVTPVGSATLDGLRELAPTLFAATLSVPQDSTANAATIVVAANAVRDPAGNGNPRATSSISILPLGPVITTPPVGAAFANAVNQNALRFAGTAPADSAVSLEVRGSIIRARINANASGDWETVFDFSGFPEGIPQTVAARFSEIGGQLSGETRISVTRDTTPPQLFIDGLPGTTLANQAHTVTFSTRDAGVTGFDRGDLTVSPLGSGSLGPFSTSDEGRTFTATFTAGNTATTSVLALLAGGFHDAAGNPNAPVRLGVRVTTLPPSTAPDAPLIAPPTGRVNYANLGNQTSLPVSGTCPANCGTLRVYVTSSVTGGGDFTPIAFAPSGPRNFGRNLDVTGLADGELTISVTASQSGMGESTPVTTTVIKDTVAPVPNFRAVPPTLAQGATVTLFIDMSEETDGFALNDITVASQTGGGSLSDFRVGTGLQRDRSFRFDYIAGNPGRVTLSVPAGRFTDFAGNPNAVSVEETIVVLSPDSSAIPTVALAKPSDTGNSDSDRLTNDIQPQFVIGNLAVGASVTIEAISPRNDSDDTIAKTLVAGDTTATMRFGNPGEGGQCTVTISGLPTLNSDGCFFSASASDHSNDGVWRISATHTEVGKPTTPDVTRLRVTLDTVMPTISLAVEGARNPDASVNIASGGVTQITASLSDPGNLALGNFTVSGGSLSDFGLIVGSDTRYTVTFTASSSATAFSASVSVAMSGFTDAAGNGNTASDRLDFNVAAALSAKPSITLVSDTGPSASDNITFNTAPDFSIGNLVSGAALVVEAANAVRGIRMRKTITAGGSSETIGFAEAGEGGFCDLLAADGSVQTAASRICRFAPAFSPADPAASSANDGEWLISATQTEPGKALTVADTLAVTLDTTAPTITLATMETVFGGGNGVFISITVNEASRGLELSDFTATGGVLSDLTGSGNSFRVLFTTGDRTTIATIFVAADSFTDLAGNSNPAPSNTINLSVQSSPTPTVALASDTGILGDNITNDGTPSFTIGNLAVNARVTISARGPRGGVTQTITATGSTATVTFGQLGPDGACLITDIARHVQATITDCTLAYTGADDGDWEIIATQNEGSKSLSTSVPLLIGIDTTPPSVTLETEYTDVAGFSGSTIRVILSEPSAERLSLADFTVTGGTTTPSLSELEGGGSDYTVRYIAFVPAAPTITGVQYNAGRFTDAAGNSNTASATLNFSVGQADVTPPTINVTTFVGGDLQVGLATLIRLQVSEPVVGFTLDDFVVAPNAFNRGDGFLTEFTRPTPPSFEYTVVFTATRPGRARFIVRDFSFSDFSGNPVRAFVGSLQVAGAQLSLEPTIPRSVTPENVTAYRLAGTAANGATVTIVVADNDDRTADVTATAMEHPTFNERWFAILDLSGLLGHTFPVSVTTLETGGATSSLSATIRYPSTQPIVDLLTLSDTGDSDSDNRTSDRTPIFALSNLVVGASVEITATGPTGQIRKRLTVTGVVENVEFGNPGAGGSCDILNSRDELLRSGDDCQFALTSINDGEWRIIANQTEGERATRFSHQLTMTLDSVGPTIALAADVTLTAGGTSSLAGDGSTVITVTVNEASVLAEDDFTVTGGSVSGLTPVADSDTQYTITFNAAGSTTPITASVSVAANAFADIAGNNNPTASNSLAINIDAIGLRAPDAPLVDLQAASDSGDDSDNITSVTEPEFTLSGLVSGATVIVSATPGTGSLKQKVLVAGDTSLVVGFGGTGVGGGSGGTCDIISASVGLTDDDVTTCQLADGNWTIVAVQVAAGGSSVAGSLPVTVDTVAPTIELATGATRLDVGASTAITVTVSEPTASPLALVDFTVVGGTLSGLEAAAEADTYTITFTASATPSAAGVRVLAGVVQDVAGNTNGLSNVLAIDVTKRQSAISIAALDTRVTEGFQPRFALNANPFPEADLTVSLSFTHEGPFVLPDDPARRPPAMVVIPANTGRHVFSILTEDTDAAEQDGSVTLTVEASDDYVVVNIFSTASVVIVSDERPRVADAAADEGEDLLFVITREAPRFTTTTDTFIYEPLFTGGRTAFAVDLIPAHRQPRTLTMPLGQRTATLTVTTLTDDVTEGDETFTLEVYRSGGLYATAIGTIYANAGDATLPGVSLSFEAGGSTVTEVDEGTTFDIVFSFNTPPVSPNLRIQLYYDAGQVGRYIPAANVRRGQIAHLIVPAENGTVAEVRVPVTSIGDDVPGADGRYTVTLLDDDLTDPLRSNPNVRQYDVGMPSRVTLTILNDDASVPTISIEPVSTIVDMAINEDTDLAFQLSSTLDIPVDAPVDVLVLLEATGGDYIAGPLPRTITVAVTGEEEDLLLPVTDDSLDEPNGVVTATIQDGGDGYLIGVPASSMVTIFDRDDPPVLHLTGPTDPADDSSGVDTTLEFVLELRDAMDALHGSEYTVTVDYATSDGAVGAALGTDALAGTDYTAAMGTLSFAPGENQKTITVTVLQDNLDRERAEVFTLGLSNLIRATFADGTDTAAATGTITAEDRPTLLVTFDNPTPRVGESTIVRMIASKPIIGFERDDLSLVPAAASPGAGILSNFTEPVPPSLEYTVDFEATQLGQVLIRVAARAFRDEDDNFNDALAGFVNVVRPVPGEPSIDLQTASDSGSDDMDSITNVRTPIFDITDLETNATVTVEARRAVGSGRRKVIDDTGTDTSAVVGFGNPGPLGDADSMGNCDIFSGGMVVDDDVTGCSLAEGDWDISAFQITDGGTSVTATLAMSIDLTDPTVTLATGSSSLTPDTAATLTISVSESTATELDLAHFTVSPQGAEARDFGFLTNLVKVADSNDYTVTFIAGVTSTAFTATIGIAADVVADIAGNDNGASNVVSIAVSSAQQSAQPTFMLLPSSSSDTGISDTDGITNDTSPTFQLGNVVVGATVTVEAAAPTNTFNLQRIRISAVGVDRSGDVNITFADTGATCDILQSGEDLLGEGRCALPYEGVWTFTATQTQATRTPQAAQSAITLTLDTTAPVVTLTVGNSSLVTNSPTTITVSVSESTVAPLMLGGFGVDPDNGAVSDLTAVADSLDYTVVFTAGANALPTTVRVFPFAVADVAGNGNDAANLAFEILTTPRAIVAINELEVGNYINTLNQTAITVIGTATPDADIRVRVSDTNTNTFPDDEANIRSTPVGNWMAAFNLETNGVVDGDIIIEARATKTGFEDSLATKITVIKDTVLPTVTIAPAEVSIRPGATTAITFTGSEALTGFAMGDVSVTSGTLSDFAGVSATVFTATFTAGGSPATVTVSVSATAVTDVASNPNAYAEATIAVQNISPVPTVDLTAASDSESETDFSDTDNYTLFSRPEFIIGNLVADATVVVYVQFPEGSNSAGFGYRKTLTVPTGMSTLAVGFGSPGSGGNCAVIDFSDGSVNTASTNECYFAQSVGEANGDFTVTATQTAPGLAVSLPSTALTVTLDTIRPTVTLTTGTTSLAAGASTTITVTSNEDIYGLELNEFTVVGGGELSGLMPATTLMPEEATNEYTVVFKASDTPGDTYAIHLPASSFTDLAGNNNRASVPDTLFFDSAESRRPTLALDAGSDSGYDDSDNITSENEPVFNVSNQASGATVVVEAFNTTTTGSSIRITLTGGDTVASFTTASSCELISESLAPQTVSDCSWHAAGIATVADWRVTTTQTEPGKLPTAADELQISFDSVLPTITLVAGVTSLGADEATTITVNISEPLSPDTPLTVASFTITTDDVGTPNIGTISNVVPVPGGNNYTATFTASNSNEIRVVIATIQIAADLVQDFAGNDNEASNALRPQVRGTGMIGYTMADLGTGDDPADAIIEGTNARGETASTLMEFVLVRSVAVAAPGGEQASYVIDYTGRSNPASNNDFIAVSGLTTIPFGEREATFMVRVNRDRNREATENFNIHATVHGMVQVSAIGTITDDDAAITVSQRPDLTLASDTGVPGDRITNNFTPAFTLGYLAAGTVTVLAVSPGSTVAPYDPSSATLTVEPGGVAIRRTLSVSLSAATSATVPFDNRGTCERDLGTGRFVTTVGSGCQMATAADGSYNGDWTIVAIQHELGRMVSPDATRLTMTLDTVAPTVALSAEFTGLAADDVTTITVSISEAISPVLTATDFIISPADGGTISNITPVAGSTDYTATFTASNTDPSAITVSVSVGTGANVLTDLAGNGNVAGSTVEFDIASPPNASNPRLSFPSDSVQVVEGDAFDVVIDVFPGSSVNTNEAGMTIAMFDQNGMMLPLVFDNFGRITSPDPLIATVGGFVASDGQGFSIGTVSAANPRKSAFDMTLSNNGELDLGRDGNPTGSPGSIVLTLVTGFGTYTVGNPRRLTITVVDANATLIQNSSTDEADADTGEDGNLEFIVIRPIDVTGTIELGYFLEYGNGYGFADEADIIEAHRLAAGNPGILILAADQLTAVITLTTAPNPPIEPAETFTLVVEDQLGNLSQLPAEMFRATGTINAQPQPVVTLAPGQTTVTEGEGAEFIVTLDRPLGTGGTATVRYTTIEGTALSRTVAEAERDYVDANDLILTFVDLETVKTITVATIDDGFYEADEELFTLELVRATGISLGTETAASVTIIDENELTVQVAAVTSAATEGTGDVLEFEVSVASGAPRIDVPVAYTLGGSAGAGEDYLLPDAAGAMPSGSVTLNGGATAVTVTVTVIDDGVYEVADDTVMPTLDGTGLPPRVSIATGMAATTLTISDNNAPAISIAPAISSAVEEHDTTLSFEVRLSGADSVQAALVVGYSVDSSSSDAATEGTDYETLSGSLTFGSADGDTQTVFVTLLDDNAVETDETITLTLTAPDTGVYPRAGLGTPTSATVTIVDDNDADVKVYIAGDG
ncbi:MAG: Ig-like domain-containing protein, partial [Pseudohongiellaceae bacterium]